MIFIISTYSINCPLLFFFLSVSPRSRPSLCPSLFFFRSLFPSFLPVVFLSFSLLSFPLPFCLLPTAVLLNSLLLSFPPCFLPPCCFSFPSYFSSSFLLPFPPLLFSFLLCLPVPSSPRSLPSFLHSSPRPVSASLFLPPTFPFPPPFFCAVLPYSFRINPY
jgi:hypothetical protein